MRTVRSLTLSGQLFNKLVDLGEVEQLSIHWKVRDAMHGYRLPYLITFGTQNVQSSIDLGSNFHQHVRRRCRPGVLLRPRSEPGVSTLLTASAAGTSTVLRTGLRRHSKAAEAQKSAWAQSVTGRVPIVEAEQGAGAAAGSTASGTANQPPEDPFSKALIPRFGHALLLYDFLNPGRLGCMAVALAYCMVEGGVLPDRSLA